MSPRAKHVGPRDDWRTAEQKAEDRGLVGTWYRCPRHGQCSAEDALVLGANAYCSGDECPQPMILVSSAMKTTEPFEWNKIEPKKKKEPTVADPKDEPAPAADDGPEETLEPDVPEALDETPEFTADASPEPTPAEGGLGDEVPDVPEVLEAPAAPAPRKRRPPATPRAASIASKILALLADGPKKRVDLENACWPGVTRRIAQNRLGACLSKMEKAGKVQRLPNGTVDRIWRTAGVVSIGKPGAEVSTVRSAGAFQETPVPHSRSQKGKSAPVTEPEPAPPVVEPESPDDVYSGAVVGEDDDDVVTIPAATMAAAANLVVGGLYGDTPASVILALATAALRQMVAAGWYNSARDFDPDYVHGGV